MSSFFTMNPTPLVHFFRFYRKFLAKKYSTASIVFCRDNVNYSITSTAYTVLSELYEMLLIS